MTTSFERIMLIAIVNAFALVLMLPAIMAQASADTTDQLRTGIKQYYVPLPSPPANRQPAGLPNIKNLVVPENTVLSVKLNTPIDSSKNKVNDPVSVTVDQPLYLGPYLAVAPNATLNGRVVAINAKNDKQGRHPYVVVLFDSLKRQQDVSPVPFKAVLIAYKTGYRKTQSLGALPQKGDFKKGAFKSTVGGALTGLMINPIFGGPIGAGAGLAKSAIIEKVARGGSVQMKQNQSFPIAVHESFPLALNNSQPSIAQAPVAPIQPAVATKTTAATNANLVPVSNRDIVAAQNNSLEHRTVWLHQDAVKEMRVPTRPYP